MIGLKELGDKKLAQEIINDLGIPESQLELYESKRDKRQTLLLILGIGTTAITAIFIGPVIAIGSGIGTAIYYFRYY
jgi:hypothetical protein